MDDFDPTRWHPRRRPAFGLATVTALFAAAVWLSHAHGTPTALPGAALGWDLLLHVERASALLGVVGIVLLVGWRAAQGKFPIKFANVEYDIQAAGTVTKETERSQEARLRTIEMLLELRDKDDDEGQPIEGIQ